MTIKVVIKWPRFISRRFFVDYYADDVEDIMLNVYLSLNEKDRRHYAAVEAIKLGHGGVTYISNLFDCSRATIYSGINEIKNDEIIIEDRIRRSGGGRTPIESKVPNINDIFLKVINEHIAGDPMNPDIRWIKLKRSEISQRMKKHGVKVSRNIVKRLLKKNGFVKRKIQRKKKTGESKDREQQFRIIEQKKNKFTNSANPIISFDTKKKENLGTLHRSGSIDCTEAPQSFDHDYSHLATGKAVPHGVYDVKNNTACVNIGINNETAEFICDSLKKWWYQSGQKNYPDASCILGLCDAGGANSYRHHIFKVELQKFVNCIQLPITIAHYPPYASKWNPIEHRLFPHVARSMDGVMIETAEDMKELVNKTQTATGLTVKTNILKKYYKKGIKAGKDLVDSVRIKKDKNLGHLNYTISPVPS